jgi:hypothetical protein
MTIAGCNLFTRHLLLVNFMVPVSCWQAVSCQELGELLSLYPIMAAGKPEGWQLSGANPPQHGGIADAAMFGSKTDRDIFRTPRPRYV